MEARPRLCSLRKHVADYVLCVYVCVFSGSRGTSSSACVAIATHNTLRCPPLTGA
jgi:hypothetical protein